MSTPQSGGLPPKDLAGAFGRAGSLVGALPTTSRRRTAPPEDDTPAAPPPASADTAVTNAPSPDAAGAQPSSAPQAAADDGAGGGKGRPVVFYVPLSVRNRLTAFRKASRATTAEVLLDAFDASFEQLPALLGAGPSGRPSRFQRTSTRRTAADDDPLVQVFVSLSAHNLGIIDDITAEVAPGATRARSKVAAAALNAFLPPTSDDTP